MPKPQRAGQLLVGRVAQDLRAAQDDDRVSSGPIPSIRNSRSAPGSSSRSIQRWGSRLRAANSRRRRVSGE
jgi:hypothetical protein